MYLCRHVCGVYVFACVCIYMCIRMRMCMCVYVYVIHVCVFVYVYVSFIHTTLFINFSHVDNLILMSNSFRFYRMQRMADSDSRSSGTPSPRAVLRRLHGSTSAASPPPRDSFRRSLSPPSQESSEEDRPLQWSDRVACWCTDCRGYVMRQYRIALRHEQDVGRCADAPPGSREPRVCLESIP